MLLIKTTGSGALKRLAAGMLFFLLSNCLILSASQDAQISEARYVPLKDRVKRIISEKNASPEALSTNFNAQVNIPEVTSISTSKTGDADSINVVSTPAAIQQPNSGSNISPENSQEITGHIPLLQRVRKIVGDKHLTGQSNLESNTEQATTAPLPANKVENESQHFEQSVLSEETAIKNEPHKKHEEESDGQISSDEGEEDADYPMNLLKKDYVPLKKRVNQIIGREIISEISNQKPLQEESAQPVETLADDSRDAPTISGSGQVDASDLPSVIPDSKTADPEEKKSVEVELQSSNSSGGEADRGIYGVSTFESGFRIESNSMLEGTPVEPGQVLTLSLQITNLSGKERNIKEEFTLPEGFALAFPEAEFTLAPMESYNSLIMINVPKAMPAGENQVIYNVVDMDDQTAHGNLSFKFSIRALTTLKFHLIDKPETVIGNQSFTVMGRVENTGNASIHARLRLGQNEHFRTKISPPEVRLGAGESADVSVEVRPLKANMQSAGLVFFADNMGAGEKNLVNQRISISMRPLASGRMDLKKRLPVYLTMKHFGEGNRAGTQWQLAGKGYIDVNNRRQIDFIWRNENEQKNFPYANQRDQLSFTYGQDRNFFKFGDQSFSLSRFTGSPGSSRGFIAQMNSGMPFEYGLMSHESRFSQIKTEGRGFYIAHTMADKTYLRLNHRVMTNNRLPAGKDEKLTSLEVKMTSTGGARISAEFGLSEDGGYLGQEDNAYDVNFSTQLPGNIGLQLSRTEVGREYGGGLSGAESSRTSLSIPVNKKISANIAALKFEQKPSAGITVSSVNQDSRVEAGMRYRMTRTRDVSLVLTEAERKDVLNTKFDTFSRSAKATINETIGRIRYGYTVERFRSLNRLTDLANWYTRQRLTASTRRRDLSLSAYGGLNEFGSDFAARNADSSDLGFSANWKILDNLVFRFNYRETFYKEANNTSSGEMSFAYRFADTSTLDLSFRNNRSWLAAEGETIYQLTYAKYLGVAVGDDLSAGGIRGIVFDAVASDSRPVANATVLIRGLASISDSSGRYAFAGLKPGTYTVDIDRRSLGVNRITNMQMPVEVIVDGGRYTRLDIGLAEGAVLKGVITVNKGSDVGSEKPVGTEIMIGGVIPGKEITRDTMPNVLVEIVSGENVMRRVTDLEGRYSFSGVMPGKWQIKAYDYSLPDGYKIDAHDEEIELTAGVEAECNFTVSQRIRKMIIIDED